MVNHVRDTPFDGEPSPTPDQLAAIVREGHLLLEAGAGSGKTTTLVDKIVYSLGADRAPGHTPIRRCELSEIAAITFTNAAAADFKRKLRDRMRLIADFHMRAGDAESELTWRNRVYEVDRARVGTIHSFCGQLLREFALRVGLDPAFQIADEGEGRQFAAEAARTALHAALNEERESAFELAEVVGLAAAEREIARIVSRGTIASEAMAAWSVAGAPRLEQLQRCIDEQREGWGCGVDVGNWRPDVDSAAARVACTLLTIASEARAALDARLAQEGKLDFDALIARTRSVLDGRPDVLKVVQRRLKWLFIDEFQDTDRDQLDIAYRICGIEPGDTGAAPVDAPVDAPVVAPWLCIVGDPKQSIYRFRRADVSLWKEVSTEFASRGIQPITLDTNFRSRAPILGYVNATFDGLIGIGRPAVMAVGHEVAYTPLVAHRPPAILEEHLELLAVPTVGTADEKRNIEAAIVGTRIREMVEKGTDHLAVDRTGEKRRIHYRDIAILFRTRTALPAYETVFRKLGIPHYVAGSSGLYSRREIRDVRLLLTALINPHDDVAWIGLLRSPFVGVSDQSLYRFRTDHRGEPFSAMLGLAADGQEPQARQASRWLGAARLMRDRMPVAALIDHVLIASGYSMQLLAESGGEQALSNLRKLVRTAEGQPNASVEEFLSFMEEREDGAARDGDAALYTAGEDVVTLSTVHGAKGLEWRIVFLASLDCKIVNILKMPTFYADPIAGIALTHSVAGSDETAVAAGAFECLRQRDVALSEAEEKRLWYVATTRAQDRLILCAGANAVDEARAHLASESAAKMVPHWLLRALEPEEDHFTYAYGGERWTLGETMLEPQSEALDLARTLPTLEQTRAASLPPDVAKALSVRIASLSAIAPLPARSATQLMLLHADPKAYRERYRSGLDDSAHAVLTGTAELSSAGQWIPGIVLGTVLHGALEHNRDDADLDEYLERELCAQLGDNALSPRICEAVPRLRRMIDATRAHASVKRMCIADRSERELAFTWFARSNGGVTLIRGALDLVAQCDGGLEILDYKSHGMAEGREQEIGDSYRVQRDVYSAALTALTGSALSRFSFFFPSTSGEAVYMSGEQETADSLVRVQALLDAAHQLPTA